MNRRDFSLSVGLGAGLAGTGAVARSLATPSQRLAAAEAPARTAGPDRVDRAHRKEWAREHFRGFENILLASFTPDLGQLDEAGIRLDVRRSIEHGFFSSLCAPAALTVAEQKRFMEIAVDEAAGRLTIGLALSAPDEAQMLALLAHAERVGCQHVLLDLPRQGDAGTLIDYARRFTRSTNLGVYLWMAGVHNFARFHPSGIPYQIFDALADEPNVIALKVGSPDPAVIFELLERYNQRMLIGALMPNVMPLAIRAYGQQWSGAWSVEALQSPEKPYATDFFRLMMQGHYAEGMTLYWEHVAPGFGQMMKLLGRFMASGGHPWEHFKYYQFLTGGNGGRYRPDPEFPDLPPVSTEDKAMIQAGYRIIGVPITQLPDAAFAVGRSRYEKDLRAGRS